MATLTLTDLDRELLDGLRVLSDQEIGRVQAHLAAGLPMRKSFGWDGDDTPSCFGCVVGTAMSRITAIERAREIDKLALFTFCQWANEIADVGLFGPLPQTALDRLAALLDLEWSRRHPVVNPVGQELEHHKLLGAANPADTTMPTAVQKAQLAEVLA